jgi:methylmalonyl-CoA mutase cobalamin-binding subunit
MTDNMTDEIKESRDGGQSAWGRRLMDTTPLQDAYRALLDAAATVADSGDTSSSPPAGEWNADQILAHVAVVNAATVAAASSIAAGANTTYDNRIALDTWTIERVIVLAGGNAGLRDRIRLQGDALCALCGPALSEAELDILVPTLLLSNDAVLVDQPMPLRDLITGLAEVELPGHTEQLLALLSDSARAEATM